MNSLVKTDERWSLVEQKPIEDRQGTGFFNVLKSALFAACGIQTKANRERDFEHGKASTFIIAGIIFVAVFVISVFGVVQLVLSNATP